MRVLPTKAVREFRKQQRFDCSFLIYLLKKNLHPSCFLRPNTFLEPNHFESNCLDQQFFYLLEQNHFGHSICRALNLFGPLFSILHLSSLSDLKIFCDPKLSLTQKWFWKIAI